MPATTIITNASISLPSRTSFVYIRVPGQRKSEVKHESQIKQNQIDNNIHHSTIEYYYYYATNIFFILLNIAIY